MVTFAAEEQAALEARAAARWARVERGELTPEEGMGTSGEWELRVGEHRLLLVPSTGEWLWLDEVHGTWEPTGHAAGQVRFGVQDGELGVKRLSAESAESPPPRRERPSLAWLRFVPVVLGLAVSGFGLYRMLDEGETRTAAIPAQQPTAAKPPAEPVAKRCTSAELRYTLAYPRGWSQARCRFFNPTPFEVPEASEVAVAVVVFEQPDPFETSTAQFTQPGIEVSELERFEIGGNQALRVLYAAPGEGGSGDETYQVAVDTGGTTLMFFAFGPYSADLAATRRVVDEMARSLELG